MRNFAIGFALALGICTVAGVAYAAIPHSGTGVITGCVGYLTGATRIIDSETGAECRPWERTVEWNQGGAPGPTGPTGPEGPGASDTYYMRSMAYPTNVTGTVACDEGDIASGGGASSYTNTSPVVSSHPIDDGEPNVPVGWLGLVEDGGILVWVVCLDLPSAP